MYIAGNKPRDCTPTSNVEIRNLLLMFDDLFLRHEKSVNVSYDIILAGLKDELLSRGDELKSNIANCNNKILQIEINTTSKLLTYMSDINAIYKRLKVRRMTF